MSIEEYEARVAAIKSQMRGSNEAPIPASTLSEDEALNMGILQPQEQTQEQQPTDNEYTETKAPEKEYEKLGAWDTTKDVAKSVGVEALHFFQKKENETQYESRTHFGENMKYIYRYGVGTAAFLTSFLYGGGEVATIGAIAKGAALASNATKAAAGADKVIKFGQGLQALVKSKQLVNTAQWGLKAAKAGKSAKAAIVAGNVVNASVDGLVAGALADFTLYRPEDGEGHLADAFGETDNPLISFLQTKETDSAFVGRLKNVVDGLIIGIPFGGAIGGTIAGAALTPSVRKFAKGLHKVANAQTAEEAGKGLVDATVGKIEMTNVAKTMDLVQSVDNLRAKANETGEEVSQLIIDNMPPAQIEEAKEIARLRDMGEEIFPHTDGTWSIKIKKWDDAYKVSPEEYQKQLLATDPDGNLGISHMNSAVESTWKQRGLVDGDGLISKSSKERTNTTNQILDYYNTKWDLDKKIKVKYGDWSEIPDARATQYKNGNVTIQVNAKSKDIYAALRSELEHARDMIKGEKPAKSDVKGSGEHFARYTGDNEAEIAPAYTYKKAVGRAKALKTQQGLDNINGNLKQYESEGFNYKTAEPNQYDPANKIYIEKDGKQLGNLSYDITDDGYLHIDHVVNETHPNNDFKKIHSEKVNGVADRLIEKAISDNPNVKGIIWNTAEGAAPQHLLKGFKKRHPELADMIFSDEELANMQKIGYNNPQKGLSDATTNSSEIKNRDVSETSRDNISNAGSEAEGTQSVTTEPTTNGNRDILSSSPSTDTRGKITNVGDGNITPQDTVANIAKGDLNLKAEGAIDNLINNIINTDVTISGATFKDVANDAESWFNKALKSDPTKAAAYFATQDPDVINMIVRQQLAATKAISYIKDLQASANPRENLRLLTAVKQLNNYIDRVGSNLGKGLVYQKIVNKAMDTFGVERFSDLALDGINTLADVLDTISSNFTRGMSLKDFKQEVLTKVQNDPALAGSFDEILGDRGLFNKVDKVLEENYSELNKGQKPDPAKIIEEIMLEDEADTCGWYAKLCDTTEGFMNTVKHWGSQAPSYVINNVLGVSSAFKNISSGVVQSNLYPTYKVLGGFLTGNADISREGVDQWLGTFVNFGESMRLAKQAFINGDGMLTNTKDFVEGNLQEGFHKWSTDLSSLDETGITLQNIHSFIPRFMMASDEFMSQLNYRNIVRAKALSQARREATLLGDVAETADTIFQKKAFTEEGKPADFKAFVEAKDMLFQVPLDRKIYDPVKGEKRNTGIAPTAISQVGSWIQQGTQKFVPLRLFMPFVKTPANIADQALQSNPLYAALNANTRKQFFSNDPEVKAKAVGKMATMLTLGGGFCFAAASGNITGSAPLDKKEKTALYKTGWQPYSIKVGDKWIPYMGLITPLDSYMAFCADMVALNGRKSSEAQEAGKLEMCGQILGMIMNDYIDQAGFRTNTAKMMDIMNPSTDVRVREQLAANMFSGFLPMSGNVNAVRSAVKTIKGDTAKTKPEGFYDNLVRNYTDLFTSVQDYQRDVFGNRIDQYGLIIAKATDDKFMQPEYAEMARLAEKGYTPSSISDKLAKTGVKLTEFKSKDNGRSAVDAMNEELTTVTLGGKTLQEAVANLIESPRYQSLPDGINADGEDWNSYSYKTKKKLLDDTFHRYYNVAKRNVIKKRGDEFVDENSMTMRDRQQALREQMYSEYTNRDLNSNVPKIGQFGQ